MRGWALIFTATFVLGLSPKAHAVPQSGRLWALGTVNLQLDSKWTLIAAAGVRMEVAREERAAAGRYLDEGYLGAAWSRRFLDGRLGLKVVAWYHFLGFPSGDAYPLSHNLQLLPSIDVRWGPVTVMYRALVHPTFYASIYPVGQRWGLGVVVRHLLMGRYTFSEAVSAFLGEEPAVAVLENAGTPYHGMGYWKSGFRGNRVYAGLDWKLGAVTLSPQYLLEVPIANDGAIAEVSHNLRLFVSLTVAR